MRAAAIEALEQLAVAGEGEPDGVWLTDDGDTFVIVNGDYFVVPAPDAES